MAMKLKLKKKDPVKAGLSDYFAKNEMKGASYNIIDTVTYQSIREAKASIDASAKVVDSMIVVMPDNINEAKEKLKEAETNRDNNTSAILKSTWEDLVAKNLQQVADKEKTLEDFRKLKIGNDRYYVFFNHFNVEEEGSAYYLTEITNQEKGETVKVAVTPKGEVFDLPKTE